MPRYRNLLPGDPAPWFAQRSLSNPNYVFDSVGGRYIVLCFFGTAGDATGRAAIDAVSDMPTFFNGNKGCFFGVSLDPEDEKQQRIAERFPGYQFFLDYDGRVSDMYGVTPVDQPLGENFKGLRRLWVILDPTLRVMGVIPFAPDGRDVPVLRDYLNALPPPGMFAGFEIPAPVIVLPNVFEPALCRRLIDLYEANGGGESGVMRQLDGKTVGVHDHSFKRRRDYVIDDPDVIRQAHERVARRVFPEIQKVHQFKASRIERNIVGCYDGVDGGHFWPHRDNITSATQHRRFALSVCLSDDYDGGVLCFPEYGPRTYKAPTGGAVVFSCTLLHAVQPVTRGRRYVYLPFLYDEAAAQLRDEQLQLSEARAAG